MELVADQSLVSGADAALALRHIKNTVRARYPTVKSSHLTEAIAAGLGFKTHAALLAEEDRRRTLAVEFGHLSAAKFQERLVGLGYSLTPDLRIEELTPAEAPKPSEQFVEWQREIAAMAYLSDEKSSRHRRVLGAKCATEFAHRFDLGDVDKAGMSGGFEHTWEIGVDHGAALPGWGEAVNSHRFFVDFPGTDHRWRFYRALPLSSGKQARYSTGLVSMPYGRSHELAKAQLLAGRIGWTCTELSEWSWYMPGSTVLHLFRPTTPHRDVLRAWERSFRRWLAEHRSRQRRGSHPGRYVLQDLLKCEHLPFDVCDFPDLEVRYLKEFVPHLYLRRDLHEVVEMRRLIDLWASDWRMPDPALRATAA